MIDHSHDRDGCWTCTEEYKAENARLRELINKKIRVYRAPLKAKNPQELVAAVALQTVADQLEIILMESQND